MTLEYVALAIGLIGLTLIFYTFIYIHDIPYQIAKKRHHPQTDAIHVACWLSVFTVHALWPLVFLWAVMKPKPVAVSIGIDEEREQKLQEQIDVLQAELAAARLMMAELAALAALGADAKTELE
ncbi:DUF3302 domain-containing protein [Dongia sp.]|uniref:DUF3302 domain-containing protein n=1 Tax=Dongia sp. TaxID=1977262 RepID=UPI0035B35991